ncbi:MAG: LacI family transcriptional regulator [Opitutales bacterium]|nr:LacI family transcriptional regulator [Opitutales bacterium]|tara:strand:+ start:5204 stop:6274 length:1071 start_codon:yes stop_codon:yes gene_type:complete
MSHPNYTVSMKEIAQEAGVSVSAVSLALRNSPKVSEKRRLEIERIAERMGYVKDGRISELMEHMRSKRSNRQMSKLAVIIPDLEKHLLKRYHRFEKLVSGIEMQCLASGYGTDYFYLKDMQVSSKRLKNILVSRGIRVVILLPYLNGVGTIDLDLNGLCASSSGYSIIEPNVNRACPNYLQMMDGLLEQALALGYRRIGFIMAYKSGGAGHKLFASSYFYYSSQLNENERIPILARRDISEPNIRQWMESYQPEAVISSGAIYQTLQKIGYSAPSDIGFASLDLSYEPTDASGVDHRHDLVGQEATRLALSELSLNHTGEPQNPMVITVDSHYRPGFSMQKVGNPIDIKIRATAAG